MEFTKDLQFRVWAILLPWLLSLAKSESRCTKSDIKVALHRCNAELSYINNAVLSARGDNYTRVCSAFSAYILCVDPRITACQNKMMKQFHHTRTTYSKAPYNCSIPAHGTIDTLDGEKNYKGQDPDRGKDSRYGFVINQGRGIHCRDKAMALIITIYLAVTLVIS